MVIALQIFNSLSAIACLLIAIRLITFKKGDKRYRFFISLMAWATINASVSIALWFLFAGFKSVLLAALGTIGLYAFTIQLFICRGNLAALFYNNPFARQ